MPQLRFRMSEEFADAAHAAFADHARRIHERLPDVEVRHTGGTSLPGVLTSGDVDVQVRVVSGSFEAARDALGELYQAFHLDMWSREGAFFEAPGSNPPVEVALTAIGALDDLHHGEAWDRIAGDRRLIERYNALKREFEAGSIDDYRIAKRTFFLGILGRHRVIESLESHQLDAFHRDGFLIVEEGLIPESALEPLRERYLKLFDGEYETGIRPDEVNWVPGRDPEDRTRQLCNAWKSDMLVAAQVLSERIGKLAAQLAGYRGVRILQDNVLWKPPGTKAIGFHQDSSYADYLVPSEIITCWMSLHDTAADAGPLAFVPGSHTWPKSPPERSQFHAPDDWLAGARASAPGGTEIETVPVVVKAGGGSFHHGLVWHGSEPNTSGATARMALVSHMIPVETRFHGTNVDVTYSRYRRRGDLSLDESFFPVMWDESGYRTPWLAGLPAID